MRFLPAGDRALLVELDTLAQTMALFQALQGRWPAGVEDVVPAARTVLLSLESGAVPFGQVAAEVQTLAASLARAGEAGAAARPDHPEIEIPVRYEGEDLDFVAGLLGMSRAEVIERHTGTVFHAAFAGFAPGFVYLADGDPCFHGVPRRASPRTRVPAGSVAMAGDFSAVYPSDSPGGWQLLGVTPIRMWDLGRAEPAWIQAGRAVRFRDLAAADSRVYLPKAATPGAHVPGIEGAPGNGAPSDRNTRSASASAGTVVRANAAGSVCEGGHVEICSVGMQTLVQDLGRPGMTAMGVSASGALDQGAARAANRIVGNPAGAAVLENLLGGLALRCHGRLVLAVTGADAAIAIETVDGRSLPVQTGQALSLNDGEVLRIGAVRTGVRCYIAARGGWGVSPVLGSCATDTLSGVGPAPLRAGDLVPAGNVLSRAHLSAVLPERQIGAPLPTPGERLRFDVVLGPRTDWFTPQALDVLAKQEWLVTAQSDRVGMRLSGPEPLVRSVAGELPSEGTVAGALQVPANGQPVLFLADHPLTGGYPVIAALAHYELDRAAQVPVGARLRFRPLGPFKEIQT